MARPKLGDSVTERLHIKITADEIEAIDDWRFANRAPSRSEAVRRLIQIGIVAERELDVVRRRSISAFDALCELIEERDPEAMRETFVKALNDQIEAIGAATAVMIAANLLKEDPDNLAVDEIMAKVNHGLALIKEDKN